LPQWNLRSFSAKLLWSRKKSDRSCRSTNDSHEVNGIRTNPKNLLVTGPPRCGKSTLIEAVISAIDLPLSGFFTREIREGGHRTGFKIITLDGKEGVLAHERIKSRVRLGKYRVNLKDLDEIAVPSVIPSRPDQIIVIDEIGKMECFSTLFREAVLQVLDSPNKVIGSIALKGGDFMKAIKKRADVELIHVSEENRDHLAAPLIEALVRG
jgi:nucleoside-triphosphatase THEP1